MIIAVDLGTTGVRVAALDQELRTVHVTKRAIQLLSTGPHRRECNLQDVVSAVVDGLREVMGRLPAGTEVAGVSFASQGEVMFAVDDDDGAPETFAVTMDNSGLGAVEEWERARGAAEFHRITGQPCHPMYPVFRLSAARGAREGRQVRLLTLDGHLREMLGGTFSVDLSLACRSGLFDVGAREWSAELLSFAGVEEAGLPEVLPAGSQAGTVDQAGSELTGLPLGAPIAVGSHDQASVFWGAGGAPDGRPVFSAGSSECLTQASFGRPEVKGLTLPSYPVEENIWLTLTGTPSGGWSLEWLAQFCGIDSVATLVEEACSLDVGPVLAHPYFAGGPTLRNDPRATGSLRGLSLTTTPAEVARALIEASGFELSDALTRTRGAFGPAHVIATAGLGATLGATQVRADAAEVVFDYMGTDATLRGAALQVLVATGALPALVPSQPPEGARRVHPAPSDELRAKRETYLST